MKISVEVPTKIVQIKQDSFSTKEKWIVNNNLFCPFCGESHIWSCITSSPKDRHEENYVLFLNSSHYCPNCKVRFNAYKIIRDNPLDEQNQNEQRSKVLSRQPQIPLSLAKPE